MWKRVGPGTCLVWGVCGLASMSSNENAGESPYSREVRDGGGPAGDIVRDGPGSVKRQCAFEAASKGMRVVRSILAE